MSPCLSDGCVTARRSTPEIDNEMQVKARCHEFPDRRRWPLQPETKRRSCISLSACSLPRSARRSTVPAPSEARSERGSIDSCRVTPGTRRTPDYRRLSTRSSGCISRRHPCVGLSYGRRGRPFVVGPAVEAARGAAQTHMRDPHVARAFDTRTETSTCKLEQRDSRDRSMPQSFGSVARAVS